MFSAHLCSVFPVSPFNEHAALAVQDAFNAHMKASGKEQSMLRMSELHSLCSSVDFKAHDIWRNDRWATNTGRLLQRVRALGQLPARILCVTNVIAGCNATSRESTDAAVGGADVSENGDSSRRSGLRQATRARSRSAAHKSTHCREDFTSVSSIPHESSESAGHPKNHLSEAVASEASTLRSQSAMSIGTSMILPLEYVGRAFISCVERFLRRALTSKTRNARIRSRWALQRLSRANQSHKLQVNFLQQTQRPVFLLL